MSKSGSFVDRTSSTVSVMTSRLRRPRKSILSRPRSSTPCISYWVTIGASAGELARLGLALDGQVGGQRFLGDDHGGGVDAVLAAQALQPQRHVDHLLDVGVGAVHGPEVGRRLVPVGEAGMLLEAVLQRGVTAHDQRRHGLGHAVADRVRMTEHPRRVPHRGPGLDGGVGDDLGDAVPPVLLGRVADHLVPEAGVEVHVDVRHGDPARVEEALEQQVVADGVEVGDVEGVGHGAPRRAPPARPHPDAVVLGVLDEVPHDEEVGAEPHVRDDLQLVGQALGGLRRQRPAPPPLGPLEGQVAQVVGVDGEALGQRELGELGLAELDGDVGPLGDPQRVVAGRRHLAEQVAHLLRRLQVVLVALEVEPVGIAHERTGLHAQQRVVGQVVLAVRVVAVVGGDERRTDPLGDVDQLGVGVALRRQPVVLQLHEQVVAPEDVLQAARLLQRSRPRRPARATAGRDRRGTRWWRSARRGAAPAAPSPAGACSSSPPGRRGWPAG